MFSFKGLFLLVSTMYVAVRTIPIFIDFIRDLWKGINDTH